MNIYDFLEYILGGNHMQPSKRVDIVSVKLVKEASILYKNRRIRSPQDCYELFKGIFRWGRPRVFCSHVFGRKKPTNQHQHGSHWQSKCNLQVLSLKHKKEKVLGMLWKAINKDAIKI